MDSSEIVVHEVKRDHHAHLDTGSSFVVRFADNSLIALFGLKSCFWNLASVAGLLHGARTFVLLPIKPTAFCCRSSFCA